MQTPSIIAKTRDIMFVLTDEAVYLNNAYILCSVIICTIRNL
jgi:hypothetical protein